MPEKSHMSFIHWDKQALKEAVDFFKEGRVFDNGEPYGLKANLRVEHIPEENDGEITRSEGWRLIMDRIGTFEKRDEFRNYIDIFLQGFIKSHNIWREALHLEKR